jgi:hypothetical protein
LHDRSPAQNSAAKILVIFGTRPEAIKLFTVVEALKQDPRFEPIVCVSAQHRAMLDQVLDIAGITPDYDLNLMRPNQTLDGLTAALLTELGAVMDKVQPAASLFRVIRPRPWRAPWRPITANCRSIMSRRACVRAISITHGPKR